ncbi:MAG: hypothetical protein A2509_10630 [Candidatus Edwardsbacteria bacterium RIFOXYD12_FULL_50_11]|uniref:Glycosyl transferase family 1 domain-containing protein n=1 Tax=Candidatus Edwardsbacteria bacterium GWF2_54_11 TaxID=1817851 RepID=A0A1F5RG60_9BACT|nr:MAG: hypothetical protein A2502_09335 [Candidatus Edwardsbacteria bacterium RifOxyC12_full_54_24]OGF07215.1 MAG: hypothetical protein A2273_01720 [Candidatus Edwardsbacteria bacterium RifOxyA12_full_54_48]OGF09470.1 MAG: hypothetical protein A3K15_08130 [Candidatus Edwardsbacteria bacterium GWE2_54_12]OGF13400.1 MAG: hypothetical protein A2024_05295 [Candidatus Edwardsbacteria bacterium GWF2_54_11]OGF17264.1 MAG: hypothetical protein A2509_10630 [Candidatus Edwardsbacteria bacterium RIFOXYD1
MVGGSVVYYYYLHSAFVSEELVVLTAQAPGTAEFDALLPYRVIRRNFIKRTAINEAHLAKAVNLIKQFFAAWGLIVKEKTDVIHIGNFYPGAFIGWLLSLTTGKHWVATVMGEDLTGIYTAGPIRRKLVLMALRRADGVLTISKYAVNKLIEHGVEPGRITLLTPGFDSAKCNATSAKEPGIWSGIKDKSILLTVGRLIERKGQDMVLRSLPIIIKDHPGVHYVIAGAGQEEARLKGLIADLGLQKQVTVVTDATDEEVAYLYQHCQIFIMPNRALPNGDNEGFGIVYLEAGYWGKPVIGGRDGGVPDAVEDGVSGLLVDGSDTGQISRAILRLLGDADLCQRMGRAGRLEALANGWSEKSSRLKLVLQGAALK